MTLGERTPALAHRGICARSMDLPAVYEKYIPLKAELHRGGLDMSGSLKVLVIDDEAPIRRLLRMGLSSQGYEVVEATDSKSALGILSDDKPTVIILDLGLPDVHGLDLLRKIREQDPALPVLVLSSHANEAAKVQALDLGADDYVTKPFGMAELLARLRTALRHRLRVEGAQAPFCVGDLSVDLVRRIVKVGNNEIRLSPKEYDLLRLFVQHAGKVLTHRFLMHELWDDKIDPQYLRVYVRQLRQKIEVDPENPQYVITETGIGYRFKAPEEDSILQPAFSAVK